MRKVLKIVSMNIATTASKVRMAERSKAPDSRVYSSLLWSEHSGPRMRAWVRIPLLTQTFCFSYKITAFSNAQALFRSLFMLLPTSNAIFIYVINFLTLWIHWMIFEWMNFEQKSPSEMNGIQTKIEWFRNILKKIYTKKKICRKTEKASSKFALLHKSRVSLHRSPMRTEAICIVCCVYLFLHIWI